MRVSLRWLREHLNFDIEPQDLLDCLTNAGLEIEETWDLGIGSGLIVVGEVKTVEKHPQADKLTVCKVDIGREQPANIVCGATNQQPGHRVPVALPGAVLPNGMTLKPTTIRGVPSEGMMCSPTELGWSDDASGILILPEEWDVGEPFDFLFDVSITANRPDCMSIFGLARDVAAIHRKKIYLPTPRVQEQVEHVEQLVHVTVKERDKCPRYCARLVRNVKVGPSPLWLVRALESVGLRSINNVVDVTNYVLMELGHPMHAFDADQITDRHIIVRNAQPGEKMKTLDDTEVTLDPEDLIIADTKRAIALAGVMGGANSEVTDQTNTVVLEAAYFDPISIRRTAKRHGMCTDSSQRFERGADRKMALHAINRATQLIREVAGGEVAKGVIDAQPPITESITPVPLRLSRVQQILGLNLPHTEIADLLVHLGCEIARADREQFFITPPSWRTDLRAEIDLIEEVARIHGYDKIPRSLPHVVGHPRSKPALTDLTRALGASLIGDGFHEVVNYGFTSSELLKASGDDGEKTLMLANPLTREMDAMRPNVLVSLMGNLAHNIRHGAQDIRLFETGAGFSRPDQSGDCLETQQIAAVMSGGTVQTWNGSATTHDFYAIKGAAERCLAALGIRQWQVKPLDDRRFHPQRAAAMCQGPQVLVKFGELHPDHLEFFDIEKRACALEIDLTVLASRFKGIARRHIEQSRQPSVDRDLALVVDEKIKTADIAATISKAAGDLLERLRLFDVYQGDHIERGKRSLAFSLVFRAPDRTLREEDVQPLIDSILAAVEKNHGAVLRG